MTEIIQDTTVVPSLAPIPDVAVIPSPGSQVIRQTDTVTDIQYLLATEDDYFVETEDGYLR